MEDEEEEEEEVTGRVGKMAVMVGVPVQNGK
jgi:hypothetical protein